MAINFDGNDFGGDFALVLYLRFERQNSIGAFCMDIFETWLQGMAINFDESGFGGDFALVLYLKFERQNFNGAFYMDINVTLLLGISMIFDGSDFGGDFALFSLRISFAKMFLYFRFEA